MAVMSNFISALKEHFSTNHGKTIPDSTKVLWVVTVPAIWPDAAKGFMRDAAIKVL